MKATRLTSFILLVLLVSCQNKKGLQSEDKTPLDLKEPSFAYGPGELSKMESIDKIELAKFGVNDIDPLVERLKYDNENIAQKGIIYFPEADADLLTGYSYGEFYDWDLYFKNVYLSYFGVSKYCFTNLKAFLARQHANGFVSRTLIEPRPYQHFKPFLAQLAYLGSIQEGFDWMKEEVKGARNTGPADERIAIMNEQTYRDGDSFYERLKKYLHHWMWYNDFDKNGLSVWNSSDYSGMDNQFSRAGTFNAFRYEGVDLACYIYREVKAMEAIAKKMGYTEDAEEYAAMADKMAKDINTQFWNEEDGFYYDRDEHVKVKSVAGFMPLFAGVATKERAERIIKEHLLNPEEFWTEHPISAYAKTEPDYDQSAGDHGCNWRGTSWVLTNYMIFHELMDYGYEDIAEELAQKTFEMVFKKNVITREYYNRETGAGISLDPFWGWSTLAYFMPFEYQISYNPLSTDLEAVEMIGTEYLGLEFPDKK